MILDLYAGLGGWDIGLNTIGHPTEAIGIELDAAACATRAAVGLPTIRADLSTWTWPHGPGRLEGLIASPPCQDFSVAGKRAGRTGDRGALIDTVPAIVEAARPIWIACEQVPPALPIWVEHAHRYHELGYSTWCGILNAADYGVPQTRRRAILLAHRARTVQPPAATHAEHPTADLFGTELSPWVSMAQALGWDLPGRMRTNHFTGDRVDGNRVLYERPIDETAPSVSSRADLWKVGFLTEKARSWVVNTGRDWKPGGSRDDAQQVPLTEPAPAIDGKGRWHLTQARQRGTTRSLEQPAQTITASADNGDYSFVNAPARTIAGHRGPRWAYGEHNGHRRGRTLPDTIKLDITHALALQSFDPRYPVTGTKTKRFEQVGNAIPPLLAAAILKALTK